MYPVRNFQPIVIPNNQLILQEFRKKHNIPQEAMIVDHHTITNVDTGTHIYNNSDDISHSLRVSGDAKIYALAGGNLEVSGHAEITTLSDSSVNVTIDNLSEGDHPQVKLNGKSLLTGSASNGAQITVTAQGDSEVIGYGRIKIIASGHSKIQASSRNKYEPEILASEHAAGEVHGPGKVRAKDHADITIYNVKDAQAVNNARIAAFDSDVTAKDNVIVVGRQGSSTTMYGDGKLTLLENAKGDVYNSVTVDAREKSSLIINKKYTGTVEAYGIAEIYAYGDLKSNHRKTIHLYDASSAQLSGLTLCFVHDKNAKCYVTDNATVLYDEGCNHKGNIISKLSYQGRVHGKINIAENTADFRMHLKTDLHSKKYA